MTVKQLIFQLQGLPEEWQELEVMLALTVSTVDDHLLAHTRLHTRQPCTTVKLCDSVFKPTRYVELTRS